MAEEVLEKEAVEQAEVLETPREPLFSKRNRELISDPFDEPNYRTGSGDLFSVSYHSKTLSSSGYGHFGTMRTCGGERHC